MAPKDQKDQYDYLSESGSAEQIKQRSILQANNEARMREKDREEACRAGKMEPYEWDELTYRTRRRYDSTVDYPGVSTHRRSEDDVI